MSRSKIEALPKTVVFVHIMKTAGVTLNQIIEGHYRSEQIYSSYNIIGNSFIDYYRSLSAEQKQQIRLIRV